MASARISRSVSSLNLRAMEKLLRNSGQERMAHPAGKFTRGGARKSGKHDREDAAEVRVNAESSEHLDQEGLGAAEAHDAEAVVRSVLLLAAVKGDAYRLFGQEAIVRDR